MKLFVIVLVLGGGYFLWTEIIEPGFGPKFNSLIYTLENIGG